MNISRDGCRTLGHILRNERDIQVQCQKCDAAHEFSRDEIAALADKVGEEYSLLNRRCRCRLTPGCDGWNRFFYKAGVYRPLFTPECSMRWSAMDRKHRTDTYNYRL